MSTPRNTGRRRIPSPARLGISRPTAQDELSYLGWDTVNQIALLRALSRSPDPNLCLAALVRLRDNLGDQWERLSQELEADTAFAGKLVALLGSSTALADHLIAHPHQVFTLHQSVPPFEEMLRYMLRAVGAAPVDEFASPDLTTAGTYRARVTGPQAIPILREAYRDILCIIAAEDVAHTVDSAAVAPTRRETSSRLTEVAEAALTAALAVAVATVFPDPQQYDIRLAVIAMGKCGARELNYISDVDVIFVSEPATPQVARLAGEFVRIGSQSFFDIDAALRPEGKKGDLVRTVSSHRAYYQRWAKTWEFQALLKARPMTGDMALGEEYYSTISPLVWTACEREEFVADVQRMRERVEDNLPSAQVSRELKLGRGGLRDVEFAVQLLQMVHGRTDEQLRVRATGFALDALAQHGYISRQHGHDLNQAYDFLRLLEHCLQLQHLRRTHLLPDLEDTTALLWLARAAGYRPTDRRGAVDVLLHKLKKTRSAIRTMHEQLFYRPLLNAISSTEAATVAMDDVAIERQLGALGYHNPRHALTHLRAMTSSSSRRDRIQELLLPVVLEQLSRTPNPDAGLLDYRRLAEKLADKTWYLRLLRDDGVVLERLTLLCGTSRYVPELLMNAPDVIPLLSAHKLVEVNADDIVSALEASARRHDDPETAIDVARSLRRAELARIACADILGMMGVEEVCEALSAIWVAVLDAGLHVVQQDKCRREGVDSAHSPARIAVIGMGRLGGKEIGYGSDADVMFVCEPTAYATSTTAALQWSVEVIDQLQTLLKKPSLDPPLEIDVDLRPEGKKGQLVRTLDSYRTYYEEWAEPWERQALLRADALAGDTEVGQDFLRMIEPLRYPAEESPQLLQSVKRMKVRVEEERIPRGVDPNLHTKLGRGSLSDVEWTVQLLQLQHAGHCPELRVTSTRKALAAAAQAGLMSLDDEDVLWIAWSRATATRNALVLAKGRPLDVLPIQGDILASVAVICGWPLGSGRDYAENYLKATRRARKVVERLFWGD